MFINHASKQVAAKIVYYGPGLSGKTTNLQYIFSTTNPSTRGELVSMETEVERTLFFDLLPVNVGLIKGYQVRFQLYTVPGQIFYDSTRKLVLKGADGIVFVADSQELMEQSNIDSLTNLRKNLEEHGQNFNKVPLVFQYNKRDLKSIISIEKMNDTLNPEGFRFFEAISSEGVGVIETLKEVSAKTLIEIKKVIDRAQSPSSPSKQAINFDTDSSRKLIERSEIPVKTISASMDEDYHSIELPEEEEKEEASHTNLEEMLSESRGDTGLQEELMEAIELTEDIEIKTSSQAEPEEDLKMEMEPEIEIPESEEELKFEMEPEEISHPQEKSQLEDLLENIKEISTPPVEKQEARKSSKDIEQLQFLESLKSNRTVTALRKISAIDEAITVTLKVGDLDIDTFNIQTDKTTKKITLIFDVKK